MSNKFFDLKRELDGRAYFLLGLALFALKYPIDYMVANRLFDLPWPPYVYFSLPTNPLFQPETARLGFWAAMLAVAAPFIVAGVVLSLRRLGTLNLGAGWVLVFFVPFLNILLFLFLSFYEGDSDLPEFPKLEEPDEVEGSPSIALPWCLLASLIPGGIVFASASAFPSAMGLTVFAGVPFFAGFVCTAMALPGRPAATVWAAVRFAALPVLFAFLVLMVTFVEGVGCVLMVAPFAFGVSSLAGLLSYALSRCGRPSSSALRCANIFPCLMLIDVLLAGSSLSKPVVSEIEIDAPAEVVWAHVIEFPEIEEDWSHAMGWYIPRLRRAVIEGQGLGAIRRCIFDRGEFIEPITVWDPPHQLRFGVRKAISPYDKYVSVDQGEFLLQDLPNGRTLLIGTTWYRPLVGPAGYWELWTDAFMHAVHMRALKHIKQVSESAAG